MSTDESEEMKIDPVLDAEKWKTEGNDKYKAKDYRGAIEDYTRAIDARPDPGYYTNRAAAHMMLLQFDKVIEDCDAAISLDRNYAKAFARKAKAYQSMGEFENAIRTLQDSLVSDPNNSGVLKEVDTLRALMERENLIAPLFERGQYRQALNQIDFLLNEAPASRSLRVRKLEALVGCRRYEEAQKFSNNLLRPGETDIDVLYWRARALYYLGNMDSANKHLQQALRSDPDNVRIRDEYRRIRTLEQKKELGNNAFKAGRYQEAINAWSECLEIDPSNGSYNSKLYCNRANAYSKLRQHDAAIQDCTKTIELDSQYTKAYLRRAASLFALGGVENLEACIRDYEHAMELVDDRDIRDKIRQAKIALKRAKRKDFYAILGVTQDATDAEIRKAYRTAALKWHPDRHSSKPEEEQQAAANKFKEISEAYEVLSDEEKRRHYDSGADLNDFEEGGGFGGHGMHSVDPQMIFRMFMQQGGMGGMGGMGGGMGGGFPGGSRFHYG